MYILSKLIIMIIAGSIRGDRKLFCSGNIITRIAESALLMKKNNGSKMYLALITISIKIITAIHNIITIHSLPSRFVAQSNLASISQAFISDFANPFLL